MKLLGAQEVAQTLGVTRQRVHQLVQEGVLVPYTTLAAGNLFTEAHVLEVKRLREAK